MQTEPLQPFCSCVITAHGGQKVLQQHPGGARVILYVVGLSVRTSEPSMRQYRIVAQLR
jgi:hypothetical protein